MVVVDDNVFYLVELWSGQGFRVKNGPRGGVSGGGLFKVPVRQCIQSRKSSLSSRLCLKA